LVNQWVKDNFNELKRICASITKSNEYDDLFQVSIEQFLKNKRLEEIPDSQKLYFFVGVVKRNYISSTSPYAASYKRFKFSEMTDIEIVEEVYQETPFDMKWVMNRIEDDKKGDLWYYARLFELYIEMGASVKNTAARTKIPMNSCSRDLNKYRKRLKLIREKELNNGM